MATLATASLAGMGFGIIPTTFESTFPVFDLHTHPGIFFMKGTAQYPGDAGVHATVAEMKKGNVSGAFFSMVMDMPLLKRTETGIVPIRNFSKGEGWQEYKRQLKIVNEVFELTKIVRASSYALYASSKEVNRLAGFLSCEGADFLDDASQLDEVYADGVRSIQLVHYAPNPLGDLQTHASQHNGLSMLGKEIVKKMNTLGMVIDVAHASQKTVQDIVRATQSPVILSHSILKMEPNRPIAARAISTDHAKLVAQTGGVIGAWPSGFNKSFDEYVENILRLVDVVGIDHVGLGTDMDSNFKPVLDSYQQLTKLTAALQIKGLSDSEIKKIAGENADRVLKKALKK